MPIAKTIQAPEWIESGARITGGLDLLGLRLPVQTVGLSLLDGITTVTPSIRYIAFRAWLIQRYFQSGLPDSLQRFSRYSLRMECALVLGNLLQDRSINGLIGSDEAINRLNADTEKIPISPLVKAPAATIYGGPCDQLGVSVTRADELVPSLTAERGIPLARSVDEALSKIPLVESLLSQEDLSEGSQEDLLELGAVARIDQIPEHERQILVEALVPTKPLPRERARVATYAALLALAQKAGARPSEADLFEAACSHRRFGEPILDHVADGWVAYCVGDSVAVTQEASLGAIMSEIGGSPDDGRSGVQGAAVISSLMERVEEHNAPLRALQLLGPRESVSSLSFRELHSRIQARLSEGMERRHGIARWAADLGETVVYERAQSAGAGALTLAVVSWIMASIRVGDAVREKGQGSAYLSRRGDQRLELHEVILPAIERFLSADRPLRDVAAELANGTVQQHLQIAWSRLRADPTRDVALLTTEGDRWFFRDKQFVGGRTNSRLRQALGWLTQVNLLDDGGTTSDGRDVLQRALTALSTGSAT